VTHRSTRAVVTIERHHQQLYVSPAVEELAGLTTWMHGPSFSPRKGFRVKRYPDPLTRKTTFGRPTTCLAGLQPAVIALLRRHGHEVEVVAPIPALDEPDWAALERLGPLDGHLLEEILRHDRGLLEVHPDRIDPARIVAQVAMAWPKARVAVPVSSIAQGRMLTRRLWAYGVDARFANHDPYDMSHERVVVTTYTLSAFGACAIERRDIVLCLEAMRAIGDEPRWLLAKGALWARLFAVQPLGLRPAPWDRDCLHALFGFRRMAMPVHGHKAMPVDVVFARMKGGGTAGGADVVKLMRGRIWRNRARNRRLARLAFALYQGDADQAAEVCPEVAERIRVRGRACSVAVLLENDEHRDRFWRELFRYFGGPPTKSGLGRLRVDVATFADAAHVDGGTIDVLIRADAGVGLPAVPNLLAAAVPWDSDHRLLLVDVNDRDVAELRARARKRSQAYTVHGWLPPGTDPVGVAVERFLNAQGRLKI
jgi:hypothetical protein